MIITQMSADKIPSQADTDWINELLIQLDPTAQAITSEELQSVAQSAYLFVASDPETDNRIVGMSTLALVHKPTGTEGRIEDVVVHTEYRGRGLGKKLTQVLLDQSGKLGLQRVMLTSRPSREAANALYQKMGFTQKETNVYIYAL